MNSWDFIIFGRDTTIQNLESEGLKKILNEKTAFKVVKRSS